MLIYWTIYHLILARFFKIWSKNVQIHSILHCISSTLWASYILYVYLGREVLDTNYIKYIPSLTDNDIQVIIKACTYSLGYFMADTLDIIIDYTNVKRRVYIIHHLVAMLGIYWNPSLAIYAIWCLEIGGIVHHLKHASEVNEFGTLFYILSHLLYHIVYLSSRLLLNITLINGISFGISFSDIIGMIVGFTLLFQNYLWWWRNLKRSLLDY